MPAGIVTFRERLAAVGLPAGVAPLVRRNLVLFDEPDLGVRLVLPPLPLGGNCRTWELELPCSACSTTTTTTLGN